MSRVLFASMTALSMLASVSPLPANAIVFQPTTAAAPVPVPNYPGCPPTTGLKDTAALKRCNDTKTPRPSFTPLLDSLR